MPEGRTAAVARVRWHLGLTRVGPYAQVVEERLARMEGDHTLGDLVEAVVIPETHFFREPARLRHLAESVIPALVDERPAGHRLQVWSAGCSTGEEPFTLAMLLHDVLDSRARVLGTDVSPRAIVHAQEGRYGRWSFRGVPAGIRERYFTPDQGRLRISPQISEQVSFKLLNLVSDPYPGGLDLILCRNVLVYLDRTVQQSVTRRLADALAPGGWLMTAASDPILEADAALEWVRTPVGLLYRRPAPTTERAAAVRPHRPRATPAPPSVNVPGPATARHVPEAARIRALVSRRALDDAERAVRQAIDASPLDAELRYLHAVIALEAGRPDDALAAGTAAGYLAPGLAAVHVILGHAHQAVGQHDTALRSWDRARVILRNADPDDPVAFAGDEPAGRLLGLLDAVSVRSAQRLTGVGR